MKKILIALCALLFIGFAVPVHADQWVNGYYRSNGTYVNGYYRSDPDGDPYNNYSYPGNYNPWTEETASGNTDTYLERYTNSYDDSPGYDRSDSDSGSDDSYTSYKSYNDDGSDSYGNSYQGDSYLNDTSDSYSDDSYQSWNDDSDSYQDTSDY